MSDFGDFDPDDAVDREPPDPEQVTYRVHELRRDLDVLIGSLDLPRWDDLSPAAQNMARGIGAMIVNYILTHEPEDAEELARALHDARRFVATSPLPAWDDLTSDDRDVGIALMSIILNWLRRQGALDAA